MKNTILLLMFFLLPFTAVRSQNPNLEKLNAYKIGFFTKRLSLTSSEAEKFWPIYNEYQDQKNRIQEERIALIRNFNQNGSSMSDKETAQISDRLIETVVFETELAVNFHKKLREVLPSAKVIRYYQAENQYKAALLNELQNRQQNRPAQNRPFQRDLPDPA